MTKRSGVPANPAELSARWLDAVLHDSGVIRGGSITSIDVEIIGQDRGFTGVIAQISLNYDTAAAGPASLVAKFPLAEPGAPTSYRRAQAASLERSAREARFYRLIDRGGFSQIPVCYFAHADVDAGEVVLLLEDLSGGEPGDALAGCTVDEARAILNGIRDIHVRWWDREGLRSFGWLPVWADSNQQRAERYRSQVESVVQRFGDRFPEDIVSLMRALPSHFDRILAGLDASPRTLIHADLHLDNVIFHASESRPAATIIDWQSVASGPLIVDIAGFVVESLGIEDRRAHEDALLGDYLAGLKYAGVTGYSLDDVRDDYLRALIVRLAGNVGWLSRVNVEDLLGRERGLVQSIFEPGRLVAALLDHDAAGRLGIE